MVMSPYVKTILRSIKMTLPRFLAIFAIIALGVGFFSGLKLSMPSFVRTADIFIKEYDMFDFKFLSTIGFEQEDIDELAKQTNCIVEGSYTADCSAYRGGSSSADTVRFMSITKNVNKLKLEQGRMPEKPDEIVIDGYMFKNPPIGEKLVISEDTSEDALKNFKYREYTIVGTVRSPVYLNFQRGTSDEGDGSVSYFVCALPEAFDSEYFTEAYLFADTGLYIYSDAYKEWAKEAEEKYEGILEGVVKKRFDRLLKDEYRKISEEEQQLIEKFKSADIPALLAINKIDTINDKTVLAAQINEISSLYDFCAVVPCSAQTGSGIDILKDEMRKLAPEGDFMFDEDTLTDQPERVIAAEIIREKLLRLLEREVPHGSAVFVERMKERESADIIDIDAVIYCERDSHKGIIIGKGGSMLKRIGTYARQDMEKFFDCKINLQIWVKVKEDWRNRESILRSLGYDENEFN